MSDRWRPGAPVLHDASGPMPLHPDELAGEAVGAQQLASALDAARALEQVAAGPSASPSAGFADRVMASIATEPVPSGRGYLVPLRRLGLAGLGTSLRQAWVFATRGGRPLGVRATALAYVLAIVIVGTSLTGVAAYGVAGAFGLLGPDRSPTPTETLASSGPIDEPTPTAPAPSIDLPTSLPSPEPTESPEASEEPEATDDDDDRTAAPESTPEESDDDDHAADPTRTPRPSDTPKPSSSPDDD